MAVLSDPDRLAVHSDYMSTELAVLACLKADIRAAVNALDNFLNANAAAINQAIPQPARGALTTEQKARLLMLVIRKRYLSGA